MSQTNSGNPKPQTHLHTAHILIATMASLISVIGGIYSLKSNFFQEKGAHGKLTGYVRDERLAKPLRLATVEVFDTDDGIVSTLSTDDEGLYTVEDLKEGNYRVKATAPIHAGQVKRVTIQKNRTSTIDFNLTPVEESLPPPITAYPPTSAPEYETVYPDSPPPRRSYPYPSSPPADGNLTPRQPTGRELLVKTGALFLQQMLEKRKKTSTTSNSGKEA